MGMMHKMMGVMMDSMSTDEKQDSMMQMMPMMMKRIQGSEIMGLIGKEMMDLMFVARQSQFGFDETIQKVKQCGEDAGWFNPMINNHEELEKNLGLEDPNKVATVSMCIARSAARILNVEKRLGVMMPLQINIFEEEGRVYVSWMNLSLMGKAFGSVVSEIMKKAESDLVKTLETVLQKEDEEKGEDK